MILWPGNLHLSADSVETKLEWFQRYWLRADDRGVGAFAVGIRGGEGVIIDGPCRQTSVAIVQVRQIRSNRDESAIVDS